MQHLPRRHVIERCKEPDGGDVAEEVRREVEMFE
jgi:hypothetical protein